jgi:hypothetical protein
MGPMPPCWRFGHISRSRRWASLALSSGTALARRWTLDLLSDAPEESSCLRGRILAEKNVGAAACGGSRPVFCRALVQAGQRHRLSRVCGHVCGVVLGRSYVFNRLSRIAYRCRYLRGLRLFKGRFKKRKRSKVPT